jgi:hypothetical protein
VEPEGGGPAPAPPDPYSGRERPSLLRRQLLRLRYEIGSVVRKYPGPYLALARRRHIGEPVTDETKLVIEGFPRSGNTFAVAAFGFAQPASVRVARHEHAPAQVIEAARRGIPALVVIRDPEDAVLSFVIQHPHIPLRQALRAFVRFYEPLVPYRTSFVLATFEQVTTDYGDVMRRVNRRFGTDFGVFEHTEENVRACIEEIDLDNRRVFGSGEVLELMGARPSERRSALKARLRERYPIEVPPGLRARAEQVYGLLVTGSSRLEPS